MFNLIKNKFIKNNVYEDISIVYDVVDVCDNYISIKNIWKTVDITKYM